jgi:signal transduction histidine kinase
VPDEDLPHLFEPFFRAGRDAEGGASGLGVGLALCKRIAEIHGGSISAANRPSGGLTVRVELPLAKAP